MEEYITIIEAARRTGMSDKTIRRAIHAGKLTACYPHPNRALVSTIDLQAWHTSLTVRPGETEHRIEALETRVAQLESEVKALRSQLENALAKKAPKTDKAPPDGFTYLSDFCRQHFVPYRVAEELFPRAIYGQKIKIGRRLYPMIGPKGRHDFWVQLHTHADFRSCDDCPHEEHGHGV
jgi:excisionase family DNA binding protein